MTRATVRLMLVGLLLLPVGAAAGAVDAAAAVLQGAAAAGPAAGAATATQEAPGARDGSTAPAADAAGRLDTRELEARTSDVASGLRCPVCQGVSVEDSPTELARQMRAVVREQLAAGRSPDEVRAYFVGNYGEWILLEPKASGFNLVVYVLPWVAVLIGMLVIVLAVRRWTRPLPTEASQATQPPETVTH